MHTSQRFGSSKPVSEEELMEAKACLVLLKQRMARNPPKYFSSEPEKPSSNYRSVFKPNLGKPEPKAQPKTEFQPEPKTKPPIKKPNYIAKESSKGFSQYDFETVEGAQIQADDGERVECPDCGRKFAPESIEKHAKVCKKVFMSKRKKFDMTKQRETAGASKTKDPPKPSKNTKWKQESEQFRANMRAARLAGSGNTEAYQQAAETAAKYNTQNLKPCPHCGRTFNEDAASRHIPICAKKAKNSQFKRAPSKPIKARK